MLVADEVTLILLMINGVKEFKYKNNNNSHHESMFNDVDDTVARLD
jgi:hypothetical protein